MYQKNPLVSEAKNYFSGLYGRQASINFAKARKAPTEYAKDMWLRNAQDQTALGRRYSYRKKIADMDKYDLEKYKISKKRRDSRLAKAAKDNKISKIYS